MSGFDRQWARGGHVYFELVEKDPADPSSAVSQISMVIWRGTRGRLQAQLAQLGGPGSRARRPAGHLRGHAQLLHAARAPLADRGGRGPRGQPWRPQAGPRAPAAPARGRGPAGAQRQAAPGRRAAAPGARDQRGECGLSRFHEGAGPGGHRLSAQLPGRPRARERAGGLAAGRLRLAGQARGALRRRRPHPRRGQPQRSGRLRRRAAGARHRGLCPLPVLTGIGHEIDRSVADEVAQRAFKTPTAVAQFLVQRVEDWLARLEQRAEGGAARGREAASRREPAPGAPGARPGGGGPAPALPAAGAPGATAPPPCPCSSARGCASRACVSRRASSA